MDRSYFEAPSSQVQGWFKFELPTHVVGRDGVTVAFDTRRIADTLSRVSRSTGEFDEAEVELLVGRVVRVLRHRYAGRTASVDEVQDVVEQTLFDADYPLGLHACRAQRAQGRQRGQRRRTPVGVGAAGND